MVAFFGGSATGSGTRSTQCTLPGAVIAFGLYSSLRPHDSLGGQSWAAPSESLEGDYDRSRHDHFPEKTIDSGDFLHTPQAGICTILWIFSHCVTPQFSLDIWGLQHLLWWTCNNWSSGTQIVCSKITHIFQPSGCPCHSALSMLSRFWHHRHAIRVKHRVPSVTLMGLSSFLAVAGSPSPPRFRRTLSCVCTLEAPDDSAFDGNAFFSVSCRDGVSFFSLNMFRADLFFRCGCERCYHCLRSCGSCHHL